jgi:hypothetical protein
MQIGYNMKVTLQSIKYLQLTQNERCGQCLTKLKDYLIYNKPQKLLIFEYPYTITKTNYKIKIKSQKYYYFVILKRIPSSLGTVKQTRLFGTTM